MISAAKKILVAALLLVTGYWVYSAQSAESIASLISALIGSVGYWAHSRKVQAVPNLEGNTIHLCALVEHAYITDRLQVLKDNLRYIALVDPAEMTKILDVFYITDRPKALEYMCRKLARFPTDVEVSSIISSLYITDRLQGAKAIASAQVASNNSLQGRLP